MKVLGTLIRPHYKASPSEHGGCFAITQLREGVHELTGCSFLHPNGHQSSGFGKYLKTMTAESDNRIYRG